VVVLRFFFLRRFVGFVLVCQLFLRDFVFSIVERLKRTGWLNRSPFVGEEGRGEGGPGGRE
jgi:hypothetical protein